MSTQDRGSDHTTVEYLILGLVAWLEPCTSYDLKRDVERTISRFWSFSHTAIYQVPPQLVAAGLLTEEQEEGGRRRRMYRLTAAGRAALQAWLAKVSAQPIELRDLALLKLFLLGSDTKPDQAYALATAQVDYHTRRLGEFKELAASYCPEHIDPEHSHPTRPAALRLGIKLGEAALEFWTELAADEAENLRRGIGTSMPARDMDRDMDPAGGDPAGS